MGNEDIPLRLDWSGAEEAPVEVANQFAVTATPEGHVLTFGFVAPPILLRPEDTERLRSRGTLRPRIASRVLVSREGAEQLLRFLAENIGRHGSAGEPQS